MDRWKWEQDVQEERWDAIYFEIIGVDRVHDCDQRVIRYFAVNPVPDSFYLGTIYQSNIETGSENAFFRREFESRNAIQSQKRMYGLTYACKLGSCIIVEQSRQGVGKCRRIPITTYGVKTDVGM